MFLSSDLAFAANSLLPIQQEDNQDLFGRELTGESIYVEVAGYEPTIVPASVLNDQNVPVYIYLKGTTLGGSIGSDLEQAPLYGLPKIKNMQVIPVGPGSQYVSGINYIKPLRSEYTSDNRFYNLGYLIVNLKKITNNNDLPDMIDLNLSARIEFELDNAFGDFGAQDLVLGENLNEEQWKTNPTGSFWGRSGYIRVEKIDNGKAVIVVYDGFLRPVSKFTLDEDDESYPILLRYGETLQNNRFRVMLNKITTYQDKAEIEIVRDGKIETKWIVEGSPIYYGSSWVVKDIRKEFAGNQLYEIVDLEDNKGNVNTLYRTYGSKGVTVALPPEVDTIGDLIKFYSEQYDVDPYLVAGLINREGIWKMQWNGLGLAKIPNSAKNLPPSEQDQYVGILSAYGYGQIVRGTAKELSGELYEGEGDPNDRFDPVKNIEMTIYYLSKLGAVKGKTDAQLKESLTAYTGGSGGNLHIQNILDDRDKYTFGQLTVPSILISQEQVLVDQETDEEEPKDVCSESDVVELEKVNENTDYKKLLCTSINELKDYLIKYGDDTNSGLVHYYLGLNYMNLGDYTEARNNFESIPYGNSYHGYAKDKLAELADFENDLQEPAVYLEDENIQLTLKSIELNKGHETQVSIRSGSYVSKISTGSFLNDDKNQKTKWYIDEIGLNYVNVKAKFNNENSERTERLYLNNEEALFLAEGKTFTVTLENIESFEEAYLTILPGTGRALSESNFMAHIGIEDYGIKFSDEQIDSQINWTEKAIKDLSGIIDKLDNIIQIGNKLCWSFWGLFTLYNIFTPDQRTARNAVMNGINGKGSMKEFCSINSGSGKDYGSYDECIFKNREQINNLMDSYEDANDKVNGLSEFDFKKDDFKFKDSKGNEQFIYQERDIKEYQRLNELKTNLESQSLEGGVYDYFINEGLNSELSNRGESLSNAKNAVKSATTAVSTHQDYTNAEKYLLWKEVYDGKIVQSSGQTLVNTVSRFEFTLDNVYSDGTANYHFDDNNEKVDLEPYTIQKYKTFLESLGGSEEARKELSRISNLRSTDQAVTSDGLYLYNFGDKFIASYTNSGELRTNYASDATVHILDNGKVKRYPIGNGDYVEVTDYYANGQPKNVEKWNVGRDGLLGTSDDVPLMSSDRLNFKENLNEKDNLRRKVSNAGTCESGEFTTVAGVGEFLCDSADAKLQKQLSAKQCTDVFSIEQCQVLFNFCDPVMCPASRFNFGGKYEVDNVVQTGLIGSLVLGWPNWAPISGTAQVIPPICLTGVSSSTKSYRSMLEGYNECLKVSKERGENVGICEKIRSVFWCELAWREASAIGDALIKVSSPTDIYNYLGSSGGGEYSSLQSAATYVSDSSSFFTKEYAKNAFAAYKARSTAEIGTQICQAFIGAKGPNFGEFLDELTKPESPPQFTAYFDEKLWSSDAGYTTANSEFGLGNIEEQSSYNVYYHIYAGEDRDVRYTVFLRDDYGNVAYVTDRAGGSLGFIPKGGFADKNIDFIGRSGYKEICVVINGQVECGFGKSSTSFGLNRLSDSLVASDAANKQINSKEQCVPEYTGPSTSFGGIPVVLPTNIAGVTTPNGIVRLCSITDPDEGTNSDNYKNVGTCGQDELGRNLGSCWIDLRTVTRAIKSTDFREDITSQFGTALTIDDKLAQKIYNDNDLEEKEENKYFTKSAENFVYINPDLNVVYLNNIVELENELKDIISKEAGSYRDLTNYNFGTYGKLSKIRIAQVYYAIGKYLKDKLVVNAEAENTIENIVPGFIGPLPLFDCEFEYIDGSLFTRSITFKFNKNDSVWYWKESNPTLFSGTFGQSDYGIIDQNSLASVFYTYDDIFRKFLISNSPTYIDGLGILLSYIDSNQGHVLKLYQNGKFVDDFERLTRPKESAFNSWSGLCHIVSTNSNINSNDSPPDENIYQGELVSI